LNKGLYVIIPCTADAREHSPFHLRVFAKKPAKINLKQLQIPEEMIQSWKELIKPEENEGNEENEGEGSNDEEAEGENEDQEADGEGGEQKEEGTDEKVNNANTEEKKIDNTVQ
jgi:regulator of protease activity HflC (stomatin/prohibitin superfamily)